MSTWRIFTTCLYLGFIAGTAWMEENKPWIAKGPSGIALRSLVEFVKSYAA